MTRQEAVKWLSNLKMDIGKTQHQELWHYEQALDEIIQTLEQEPKRGKWIPVTERLPKVQYGESKPVLVTECWKYDNGTSFAIRTAEYDGSVWHDGTGNVFTETKVIAWMPLPEPYVEGAEQ